MLEVSDQMLVWGGGSVVSPYKQTNSEQSACIVGHLGLFDLKTTSLPSQEERVAFRSLKKSGN